VKISDENFDGNEEINVEGLIFNSNETGQIIRVSINESAERAFKANLPTKIIKLDRVDDKKIKVEFRFDNLDYLNDWLLQFGNNVKVISPENLKKKREKTLKKMLNEMMS